MILLVSIELKYIAKYHSIETNNIKVNSYESSISFLEIHFDRSV